MGKNWQSNGRCQNGGKKYRQGTRKKQEVSIGQTQSFFAWLNAVLPKAVNLGLKKTNGACRTVTEKAALN